MNRTVAALLALLAVLALGAAAATLDTATTPGGSTGSGDSTGAGVGSGDRLDLGAPAPAPEVVSPPEIPDVLYQLLLVLLGVVLLYGLYEFYREYGLSGFVVVFGIGVVLTALLWLLWQGLPGGSGSLNGTGGVLGEGSPSLPGGAASGDADGRAVVTQPPSALVGLFALVLVGAVVLVARASGDDVTVDPPEPESTGPTEVAEVARAAGRAADRIEESAPVDNEVYRAWQEMTRHLDVANPAATTPAEFADAAVAAGMAREDVTALTDLFEAVRYGDTAPTEEREARAVAALRRIERTYAETEAGTA